MPWRYTSDYNAGNFSTLYGDEADAQAGEQYYPPDAARIRRAMSSAFSPLSWSSLPFIRSAHACAVNDG